MDQPRNSSSLRSQRRRRFRPRRFPRPWRDPVPGVAFLQDLDREMQAAYDEMDDDSFGWWTVITAFFGFATGAYDIFAVNMVTPIINIIYWDGNMPKSAELSINMATLVGTLIGQLVVGYLGDRYGRKKMYGALLVVMIVACVPMAALDRGPASNINVLAWMVSWRVLLGIAIGGDYPLTAVITAEFAPRKHRAQMLSTVFYAQPIGQLVACLVSVVVTAALRHRLLGDASPTHCVGDCFVTIDLIWRWIVGFGAVPPIFAVILRFWIPESPRWLLEVKKNPIGIEAAHYTRHRFNDVFEDEEDVDDDPEQGTAHDSGGGAVAQQIDIGTTAFPMDHLPGQQHHMPQDSQGLSEPTGGTSHGISSASSALSMPTTVGVEDEVDPIQTLGDTIGVHNLDPKLQPEIMITAKGLSPLGSMQDGANSTSDLENHLAPHESSLAAVAAQNNRSSAPSPDTWTGFWSGFGQFMATDGNWTDLAGTSITWFLLDFAFYMILVNSQKLIAKIWDTPDYTTIYPMLMYPSYRAIVSTSVGALIGGALFIAMARHRWKLQFYGFLILAVLFMVVGVCFITLLGGRYFAAIIVLYCLCNLFFDFGPNTSTYVISAEVFPTRYRATCVGISAGAGKLGSIITQLFLSYARFRGKGVNDPGSHWLGYVLMIQAAVMLLGAFVTKAWVPQPCDIDGNSRSLEDLGQGKAHRLALERAERTAREAGSLP